jgi:nitroreductase
MNEIFTRTSIRQFADRMVEKEKVEQLLKAAMQAPSAGDQRPWEFYVITNRERLVKLAMASPYAGPVAKAPMAIVVGVHKDSIVFPSFAEIDCAIATENIWLELETLGLGGVMIGIAPEIERMEKVAAILSFPKDIAAFSILPIGYPVNKKPQRDRFDVARIHYIE